MLPALPHTTQMVNFVQSSAVWLSLGLGTLLVLELMMMVNACRLRRHIIQDREEEPKNTAILHQAEPRGMQMSSIA